MDCHAGHGGGHSKDQGGLPRFLKIFAIAVFAVGGVYYLWSQHKAHVLQFMPAAVFLLCPLMHLFGGHGGHGGAREDQRDPSTGGEK